MLRKFRPSLVPTQVVASKHRRIRLPPFRSCRVKTQCNSGNRINDANAVNTIATRRERPCLLATLESTGHQSPRSCFPLRPLRTPQGGTVKSLCVEVEALVPAEKP